MADAAILQQLQAEATRRFSGQVPSTAGVGAPVANSPAPQNPLAARAQMVNGGAPAAPTPGDPFSGATQVMNGSIPMKGGTMLEKALVKRLGMYPPA